MSTDLLEATALRHHRRTRILLFSRRRAARASAAGLEPLRPRCDGDVELLARNVSTRSIELDDRHVADRVEDLVLAQRCVRNSRNVLRCVVGCRCGGFKLDLPCSGADLAKLESMLSSDPRNRPSASSRVGISASRRPVAPSIAALGWPQPCPLRTAGSSFLLREVRYAFAALIASFRLGHGHRSGP